MVHGGEQPGPFEFSNETIATAEIQYIERLEELFDFDQENFFNPLELIFPDFVYAHEGSTQEDFIYRMEVAVSERGFHKAARKMESER